jgi:hypothetical protein
MAGARVAEGAEPGSNCKANNTASSTATSNTPAAAPSHTAGETDKALS